VLQYPFPEATTLADKVGLGGIQRNVKPNIDQKAFKLGKSHPGSFACALPTANDSPQTVVADLLFVWHAIDVSAIENVRFHHPDCSICNPQDEIEHEPGFLQHDLDVRIQRIIRICHSKLAGQETETLVDRLSLLALYVARDRPEASSWIKAWMSFIGTFSKLCAATTRFSSTLRSW